MALSLELFQRPKGKETVKYEKSENSQWIFFGFGRCKTMDECVYTLWPSPLPWEKKKKTCIEQICSLERYGIFVGVGQAFVAGQWPWAAEVACIFSCLLPLSLGSTLADAVAFIQSNAGPF